MEITIVFLTGLVMSAALPLAAIPLLRRAKVIDIPNSRSLHDIPAVRGIGVVSTAGVFAAWWAAAAVRMEQTWPLAIALGGCIVAAILGLAEDIVGLRVGVRLLAQGAVGICVGSVALQFVAASWWWLPVIIVLFVGYINTANFMDGVNGISCLHGLVTGVYFVVMGILLGQPWMVGTATILFAVHLGLLPWNARGYAFLGDVGSYLLGALVAICGIGVLLTGGSILLAAAPTLVYLADTAITVLARLRRRERITEPHRAHVYQRLVLNGMTHLQSAMVVTVASAVCSIVAIAVANLWISSSIATLVTVAILVGYMSLPRLARRRAAREDL